MNLKLLTEFKELLLNELYPIGKTEIFYDNADHSNYLGFKWERTALDRFIKGYSPNVNTIASTGGKKTHAHTLNDGFVMLDYSDTNYICSNYKTTTGWTMNYYAPIDISDRDTSKYGETWLDAITLGGKTDSSSNEPQFQVFAIWRRVS